MFAHGFSASAAAGASVGTGTGVGVTAGTGVAVASGGPGVGAITTAVAVGGAGVDSLMGVIAAIRQVFFDAQWWTESQAAAARDPLTTPRVPANEALLA